jgi:hypothetical protein
MCAVPVADLLVKSCVLVAFCAKTFDLLFFFFFGSARRSGIGFSVGVVASVILFRSA